jgi:hypothetical protein
MSIKARNRTRGNNLVIAVLLIGLLVAVAGTSEAVLITITNTSSSFLRIRDESAGNVIVADITGREGVYVLDLTDNHNYRLKPGVEGDQGSHYFKVVGGQITYDPGIPPTAFFTN